jgi:hypothetical protein
VVGVGTDRVDVLDEVTVDCARFVPVLLKSASVSVVDGGKNLLAFKPGATDRATADGHVLSETYVLPFAERTQ